MSKIHVLDKHTAELIAAGEVVERPSSVIKELVENAIDAGSSSVTVEIENGGTTMMRISDNGCGIARDDIKNAFLRHATSKISTEDDLNAIGTLGFRGEALASIAAVARVDLLTKTKEETFGTRYVIEGGEEQLLDDAGCPDGTTFVIRDLFYNTPARMKFLKKNVSEGNAVSDVIDRMALSHPEVSFRLIRDGKQTLLTPGDGKLYSAIYAVYGKEFAETLVPVAFEKGTIRIEGYTCKPLYARKTRSMQLFFINGRFVKTATGSVALQEAYKNAIMVGKFPAGVYHITFPFSEIDVNVHPAKIEVRFSNERAVFDVVYCGVKAALEQGDTRPELVLPKPVSPVKKPESRIRNASSAFSSVTAPGESKSNVSAATVTKPFQTAVKIDDRPVAKQTKFDMVRPEDKPVTNVSTKLNDSASEMKQVQDSPAAFSPARTGTSVDIVPEAPETAKVPAPAEREIPSVRLLGEAFHTYVFAEVGSRILILDKHAAHERILFDQLKKNAHKESAQMLLQPIKVTLRRSEYSVVIENLSLFESAGFLVEPFGDDALVVRAVPMNLDDQDVNLLLQETAGKLIGGFSSVEADRLDWLYHSIACKSAVKGGWRTSDEDLLNLAKRIVCDDSVRYCPHGRPVAFWLTRQQLEKQFGRG